jgi:ABC-type sugar transport system ATPase subunit
MVTHRLGELRIADDITVLREGRVVYREDGGERRPVADLVAEMVAFSGHAVTSAEAATARPVERLWEDLDPSLAQDRATRSEGAIVLRMENLTGHDLRGLSIDVCAGEVVGFVGLPEGGIRELPRILAGSMKRKSGAIVVGSHAMSTRSTPREFINAGLMSAPSDRLREGGVASLSMTENVTLPSMSRYWHRRAKRRRAVNAVIEAFDVRPRIPSTLFGSLSGGNQQKVLLGKWLLMRPIALVLDDPTYGVDPAARELIFSAMTDAARSGVAVLFFSTEPELLSRVCGRVEVVREGIIEKELSGDELTPEALMEWSYA